MTKPSDTTNNPTKNNASRHTGSNTATATEPQSVPKAKDQYIPNKENALKTAIFILTILVAFYLMGQLPAIINKVGPSLGVIYAIVFVGLAFVGGILMLSMICRLG